jgi:hypothetical protein
MKIKVKLHGKNVVRQLKKDYPKLSTKKATESLLCDFFKSFFKKEK